MTGKDNLEQSQEDWESWVGGVDDRNLKHVLRDVLTEWQTVDLQEGGSHADIWYRRVSGGPEPRARLGCRRNGRRPASVVQAGSRRWEERKSEK